MKLHERYRQFRDPAEIKANIVRSVYASMALENQTFSMKRIGDLYDQAKHEIPGRFPKVEPYGNGLPETAVTSAP